jgi:hypothetical protein
MIVLVIRLYFLREMVGEGVFASGARDNFYRSSR